MLDVPYRIGDAERHARLDDRSLSRLDGVRTDIDDVADEDHVGLGDQVVEGEGLKRRRMDSSRHWRPASAHTRTRNRNMWGTVAFGVSAQKLS